MTEDTHPEQDTERRPIMVTWNKRQYVLGVTRYVDNDNTCVVLLDPATNNVELKVSVNLHKIPAHQVYVKDYSENRGIADVMTSRRLLRKTGRAIQNGNTEFGLYEIMPKLGLAFGIEVPEEDLSERMEPGLSQAIPGREVKSDEDVAEAPSSMAALEAQQAVNAIQAAKDRLTEIKDEIGEVDGEVDEVVNEDISS